MVIFAVTWLIFAGLIICVYCMSPANEIENQYTLIEHSCVLLKWSTGPDFITLSVMPVCV